MIKKAKTLNDKAWEKLFLEHDILQEVNTNGSFIISSSHINKFREARLMTKFDHSFQLPYMFAEERLSLLPISRGEYIISQIDTFAKFDDSSLLIVQDMDAPEEWESLDYKNITSEAVAINCAYVGGLLHDFLGEEVLYPTIDGRMSSTNFSFNILKNNSKDTLQVSVNNSQIEIDGGYEGHGSLSLIEAKNTFAPDFLIRQLYYPYRLWKQKIGKPVRSIFLTYTNGIYHFREYKFIDTNLYNSVELTREKKYRFREKIEIEINIEVLESFITDLPIIEEPEIPFPQANYFDRVINLCEVIESSEEQGMTKDELLSNFYFTEQKSLDPRQVDYYVNAGRYLGFVDKEDRIKDDAKYVTYILTSQGRKLFKLSIAERQIAFVKAILQHNVFRKVLAKCLNEGEMPSEIAIVAYMKDSNLYKVQSEKTFRRRASTISAWIDWILRQLKE